MGPTIFVTVDSLRADHLGQYGYERDTMPALDRVCSGGTVFENAFSNGPYTRISIPSFHTSRYLSYGNLNDFPTIASVLESEGVRTAAIGTQTGIGMVSGKFRFGEMVDMGRDDYEQATAGQPVHERLLIGVDDVATRISEYLQTHRLDRLYGALERPYNALFGSAEIYRHKGYISAKKVTDRAISWIEDEDDREFFLWLHYMEAHRPYGIHDEDPAYLERPRENAEINELMKTAGTAPDDVSESDRRLMIDLYDSDLRYCSRHLSRLFDVLESEGLWADSNVIFSSDHGEEFGEHGLFFHRNYPYDELVNVPLITRTRTGPDRDTVAEQRELLDIAPTICSFYDVDVSDYGFLGTSLYEGSERDVVSLGQPGMDNPAASIRSDGWKYIHTNESQQLYDLESDPGEQENVVAEHPKVEARLKRKIPQRLFDRDTKAPRPPEDDVDREQLSALGYMELR